MILIREYKREFNDYQICGDITKVILTSRKGEVFECLIDTNDLQKLIDFNHHWYAVWYKNINGYYVACTVYVGSKNGKQKNKRVYLHRFLVNATDGVVDHKNHSGLDNRQNNLRIIDNDQNSRYRKGKNSNNKSGYRNVFWLNTEKKWVVQLQINGKNTRLGSFDDANEAGEYAEEMRQKYYGEFSGNQ